MSFTITILILLSLILINTQHITSKNLTGIKISHAVSLQTASLAQSILLTASDNSQTTLVLRRAKMNILNESEQITFTINEYSNILLVYMIFN